jgi:hypothetical protein
LKLLLVAAGLAAGLTDECRNDDLQEALLRSGLGELECACVCGAGFVVAAGAIALAGACLMPEPVRDATPSG